MRKDDEKHYDYTDYSDDPANNYFDENGDPILENINEIDYAEPEEEYIDLVPILQNLYFDADKFLEPIKGVKVANG